MIDVYFKKLDPRALAPRYGYSTDAGWDLFVLDTTEIPQGELTWISTGIAVAIPDGYYGRVVGRSSALSFGWQVFEGVIDAGYTGELMARVWPLPIAVRPVVDEGESICQLIVQPVPAVRLVEVDELPITKRGTNGFGSTS